MVLRLDPLGQQAIELLQAAGLRDQGQALHPQGLEQPLDLLCELTVPLSSG